MLRSKNLENGARPQPAGSWLAGLIIGSTIFSLATGAMVLGAGMAIRNGGKSG